VNAFVWTSNLALSAVHCDLMLAYCHFLICSCAMDKVEGEGESLRFAKVYSEGVPGILRDATLAASSQ
jgi:hypothetical protein